MNRSDQDARTSSGLWLAVLLVATFAIYLSGLHIWYYGDDFQYLYQNPAARIFYFFFKPNLNHGFYRPINSSIIAIVQVLFGWETWPIHVINIIVHALLAWLVYLVMKRERFPIWSAMLGSAFMVFSQENAAAVLSNDTFSQISGTFFGCLTLWLLYAGFIKDAPHDTAPRARDAAGEPFPLRYYLLSLPAFILCLLSKETSMAFLPMVGVFFLVKNRRAPNWGNRLLRTAIEVFPYFVLALAYMAARKAIGLSQPTTSDSGGYGFHFGLNLVVNLGQFLVAALLPASSAETFTAFKTMARGELAAIGIGTLAFLAAVVYGLRLSGRHRIYPVMGIFAFIGLFPAMLLNHVGELYLYNSMPFIAVIVGGALGALLERGRVSAMGRAAFTCFLAALVAAHVIAIESKAANMRTNGDRARRLFTEVLPYAQKVPQHGELVLLTPPGGPPEYSIFTLNGFSVFKWGVHVFWEQLNRTDFGVVVVDKLPVPDSVATRPAVIMTLRNDSLVEYR